MLRQFWCSNPEYRIANDGWGMCNTGENYGGTCALGGIGCSVDHATVKILNTMGAYNKTSFKDQECPCCNGVGTQKVFHIGMPPSDVMCGPCHGTGKIQVQVFEYNA